MEMIFAADLEDQYGPYEHFWKGASQRHIQKNEGLTKTANSRFSNVGKGVSWDSTAQDPSRQFSMEYFIFR